MMRPARRQDGSLAQALRVTARVAACLGLLVLASCAPSATPVAEPSASHPRWFGDTSPPAGQVLRFNNGAEPETIDPGKAAGQPDGRVIRILFEGLTTPNPRTLIPEPGQAYRWEVSADGLTYTFHLRPGLVWSDGRPITAEDFRWSWLRVLTPETAARNAGLFYAIRGAEAYNNGELKDARQVGLAAPDDSTFVVHLATPTAYFLFLTQYYPFVPVPRHVIEQYGTRWTQPGNIVSNGAFALDHWRQGDRFEFVRSPRYWDAATVRLERIVAYAVDDVNTCTNLYKAGVVDWNPSGYVPSQFVPYMRGFSDFRHDHYQAVCFYSINVTRKPFDNVWVRRALDYAVDRDAIANDLLKRSRDPWGLICPSGYPGYESPAPVTFDAGKARAALARAGFPGGKGFPKVTILINTSEDRRRISEAVQAMWKRELGIDVAIENQEWGSYLQSGTSLQYDVMIRSWIGDYLDPATFLGMLVTNDGNNRTGWSNARYDGLIRAAAHEVDAARRMRLLHDAEALALDEGPFIPVYLFTSSELVKPYVRGLYPTALDTHPLKGVWIDHDWQHRPAPVASNPHP